MKTCFIRHDRMRLHDFREQLPKRVTKHDSRIEIISEGVAAQCVCTLYAKRFKSLRKILRKVLSDTFNSIVPRRELYCIAFRVRSTFSRVFYTAIFVHKSLRHYRYFGIYDTILRLNYVTEHYVQRE